MSETRPLVSLYREALRLLGTTWPLAALATAMGVVSGFATARLLATLNRALHAEAAGSVLWSFAGLCALVLGGETISAVGNSLVGQRIIARLRREVVERIASAPVSALLRESLPTLLATVSHDVDTISAFTFNLSGFFVALAVTLGCLGYLILLSPLLFVPTVLALGIGLGVTALAGRTWQRNYEAVRDAEDELQRGYLAITQGAKELRLSQPRRVRVYRRQLIAPIEAIRDHKIVAMRAFYSARAFAGVMFFAALGALVALGARLDLDRSVVSGFALVLLFVKGPLEQVIGELPALGQARVAFRRVAEMSVRLATPEPHLLIEADAVAPPFSALTLRAVSYRFGDGGFTLGPIDLEIRRGETLFITGENGCGKTTLLMLLCGLFSPTGGELLRDGVPVTAAERDAYRQLFSAVFFDYALFADLPAHGAAEADAGRRLLERLDLAHKVELVPGATGEPAAFSTIELSAGQRKRLALVQACLEQRPIIVFDEWAAEQDPTFRRIFYTEILPELKRQGRTLICISHDDRYFDVADRRIGLHAGRLVEDSQQALAPMAAGIA